MFVFLLNKIDWLFMERLEMKKIMKLNYFLVMFVDLRVLLLVGYCKVGILWNI